MTDSDLEVTLECMGSLGPPTVSIGVPVFNGAAYLSETLQAILSQDYEDLEVIICDNASTDATADVCSLYGSDTRLTYRRFNENVGSADNFNRAFSYSRADFFCWAGADDRMRPEFVSRAIGALRANPDAALCVSSVCFIDKDGQPISAHYESSALASTDLRVRLRSYLERDGWHLIYGMARHNVLAKTSLFPRSFGGDVILVWSIILEHPLCVVSDILLDYRVIPKTNEGLASSIVPGDVGSLYRFGHCKMWAGMWRTVTRMDVPDRDARTARLALCRWLATRYWRALLFRDLYGELRLATVRRAWARMPPLLIGMLLLRPLHFAARCTKGGREVFQLGNAMVRHGAD